MKAEKVISLNVKRIRSSRGMSQVDAAKAAGISRQALSNIENGVTKEPRISNLQAIADAFKIQLMDLFVEPPKLSTVRFRSNSIKTKKDESIKEQYLIDAACWLKDFNFLQSVANDKKEYKLKAVPDEISKLKSNRPLKAAGLARSALGLKDEEVICDIVDLMESTGTKIRIQSMELEKFFGFSISEADGGPAIIVNNKNITIERQIFTVAHELGHLLLHQQSYDPTKTQESKKEEKEADIFAGYFLMSHKAFEKKLEESYGLGFVERVLHIKRFFGVSYLAVLHRLADMGISDYGKLAAKFRVLYKQKYRKDIKVNEEPFGLKELDFVEDYLSLLVRKALDKEAITVSRAAEILNVPLLEMREIINSWAEIAA
jgi:Zn-dependent peptidase ImmA (M78 family)/DNA-binding XRE family transcriptional regulator